MGMEGSIDVLNKTSAFPPGRTGSSVAGYRRGRRKAEQQPCASLNNVTRSRKVPFRSLRKLRQQGTDHSGSRQSVPELRLLFLPPTMAPPSATRPVVKQPGCSTRSPHRPLVIIRSVEIPQAANLERNGRRGVAWMENSGSLNSQILKLPMRLPPSSSCCFSTTGSVNVRLSFFWFGFWTSSADRRHGCFRILCPLLSHTMSFTSAFDSRVHYLGRYCVVKTFSLTSIFAARIDA
jgi:hypothetical protein